MLGLTEQSGDIMRTVDKLDKIGADKVRTCLTEDVGLTAEQAGEIMRFISITGSNRQVLTPWPGIRDGTRLFRPGAGGTGTPSPGICGLRRSGGELRRGSDHRPWAGLLHRHGV